MSASRIAALAALSVASVAAHAVIIYGTNHTTGSQHSSDTLIMFDSSNPGGYTVIGSTGVPGIGFGGLSFDAQGNLWGYASIYHYTGGAAAGLYRIDPTTGQAIAQGTLSQQTLTDLAYNPVDGKMYGIYTQQASISRLYTVDLVTGEVTTVGQFTGLAGTHSLTSLAIDSAGNFYVQDIVNDTIYAGNGLNLTAMYSIGQDTAFSQGMEIDWSRDDQGYHAAVGYGEFPNYFSQLNYFAADGSGYIFGNPFGLNSPDGFPPIQLGDLAIMPVPAPGAAAPLLASALLLRRRR